MAVLTARVFLPSRLPPGRNHDQTKEK